MERVEITQPMIGICHMQVCAETDATDKEILQVCNTQNPAGTSNGWCDVIRNDDDLEEGDVSQAPIECGDDPKRSHFLVAC